jgi:hypothetical protein
MGMPGRLIMAAFAIFMIWTLVRAWRTGWIAAGAMWRFSVEDSPVMYTLTFGSHIVLVAMFAAVVAGYSPAEFFDIVGFGWVKPYLPSPRA